MQYATVYLSHLSKLCELVFLILAQCESLWSFVVIYGARCFTALLGGETDNDTTTLIVIAKILSSLDNVVITAPFIDRIELAFQCRGVTAVERTHHPVVKTCNNKSYNNRSLHIKV